MAGRCKWADPHKPKKKRIAITGRRAKATHLNVDGEAKCKTKGNTAFSKNPTCKFCLNGFNRPPEIKPNNKYFVSRISRRRQV